MHGVNPVLLALLAGLFTWACTAFGAGLVFAAKKVNHKILDFSLGTAAGIMIAASFWSLLAPSLAMTKTNYIIAPWFAAAFGFILGGAFLRAVDMLLPHLHLDSKQQEGPKTSLKRSSLFFIAMTIHNFPEGLAVGVAFGALASSPTPEVFAAAVSLAIGIGIQNIPEGLAISLPLRREGFSRTKSFMYGQASALVEPMGAVLGAALVMLSKQILPYALAFAAGAMIFVVIEEVIPEAQRNENTDIATTGALLGFVIMMVLDTAFA